jgi:hypothetical protein
MLTLFREREAARVTPRVGIAFAKMIGHHDDGFSMRNAPEVLQAHVRRQVLGFGPGELAKLLFYVDEGFDRPSAGYSLMSVLGARSDCIAVFAEIRDDPGLDDATHGKAAHLIAIDADNPRYFGFWHKDGDIEVKA